MSDSEFRSVFNLLVSTTDEYSMLLPLFEESVLPRLSKTEALLDVGAGPGLITSYPGSENLRSAKGQSR